VLAAATQVTERIKLVTMGISLALYPHPVRVAEELAMVDNLSHGRLVVGLISSGAQNMYAYNVSPAEERDRYHEAYDLIVKAWTEENPFEWHSEYYNYKCVSILPRPLQVPHPPFWTTASADQSLQWAAQNHIGFIASGPTAQCATALDYYANFAETECGWTATEANRGIAREYFMAPTKAGVQEMVDRLATRDQEDAYPHMRQDPNLQELEKERWKVRTYSYRKDGSGPPARAVGRNLRTMQSGLFLVGDPESMTEQILEQQKATRTGVLIIRPEMGSLPLDQVGDSLELFSKEVLPALKKV
jgi:alkanesulfonate monooxygenase SsuD/methylene tetrahydromethanopterin reductase-like flavin-dependent oxidoreductase (luciferase family)